MNATTDIQRLENLGGLVGETDQAIGPTPEQAEAMAAEAEAATEAQAWAQIPMMLGAGLSMVAPELQAIYTPEACEAWGAAMVPVAHKYGWNGPGNLPEVGLIIATASMAVPTVVIIRAKIAEARAEAEKAEKLAKMRQGAATATDVDPMREVKQGATGGPVPAGEGADHGQ